MIEYAFLCLLDPPQRILHGECYGAAHIPAKHHALRSRVHRSSHFLAHERLGEAIIIRGFRPESGIKRNITAGHEADLLAVPPPAAPDSCGETWDLHRTLSPLVCWGFGS